MMILAVSALHRLRRSLVNRPIPNPREDIFLLIEKYSSYGLMRNSNGD